MFLLKRGCCRTGAAKILWSFSAADQDIVRNCNMARRTRSRSWIPITPIQQWLSYPLQHHLYKLQYQYSRTFSTNVDEAQPNTTQDRPAWYHDLTVEQQADYDEHMNKWNYFFKGRSEEEKTEVEELFDNNDPEWEKNFINELEDEIDKMTTERRAELHSLFVKTEEEKMRAMHQVIDWMADKKKIMEQQPPEDMIPALEMVEKLPITLEYKGDIDGNPSPAVPYPKVKLTVDLRSLGLSNRETDCFIDIVGPRLVNREKKTRTNPNPSKRKNPYVKFTCDKYDDFHQNTWGVKKLLYDCIVKAKEIEKSSRTSNEIVIDDLEQL